MAHLSLSYPFIMFGFNKKNNNTVEAFYLKMLEDFADIIFSRVLHKTSNRDHSLEITQNVFVHLWIYRKKLNDSNKESIIFKTCNQEIYKYYKENNTYSTSIEEFTHSLIDESDEELAQKMDKERMLDEIYVLLNQVPERRKEIFMMNKIDGKTSREIAEEMNVSKSAIDNQISKTMLYLKKKLT